MLGQHGGTGGRVIADLPPWVYDVVIALEEWRDTHPRLYERVLTVGNRTVDTPMGEQPIYGFEKADRCRCGCEPLEYVPHEVVAQARAIREYQRAKAASK